jgi:hypothetical protein
MAIGEKIAQAQRGIRVVPTPQSVVLARMGYVVRAGVLSSQVFSFCGAVPMRDTGFSAILIVGTNKPLCLVEVR